MAVPMPQPAAISAIQPAAVQASLTAALKAGREAADPALALLSSSTSPLRLNPQISVAPGLNPYRTALAYSALTSAAIQGHMSRLQAGDASPELLQAIAYDAFSWPILTDEMGRSWDQYRGAVEEKIGTLGGQVDAWIRQVGTARRK